MKRLLFILLAACSMLQVTWGQESSQSNTQSPFVGDWIGEYKDYVYDEETDNFRWKDFKLVFRINQYGENIDIRIKTTLPDGSLKYYWEPYTITSISPSELTIVQKTKESYYSGDRSMNHFETTYKIINEQGRLHLIPIEKVYYERYPSGGVKRTDCTRGIENMNIYLYKNDNW